MQGKKSHEHHAVKGGIGRQQQTMCKGIRGSQNA
jgi:hypothetical protein